METLDPILANHLFFMRRHRGDYAVTGRSIYIASEAPGFTSWIPLAAEAKLPADLDAVRLFPWSGAGWKDRLEESGFRPAEQLSYQDADIELLAGSGGKAPSNSIKRGETNDDARTFAEVQAAGFLEQGGETAAWWTDFFRFVAIRNIDDPQQDFLIASINGEPAAVLLLASDAGVSGIYAVATRPEMRNRGLSSALLREAANRARDRRSTRLVLQAMSGSYADGYYKRLGFAERYICSVWRRQA